MFQLDEKTIRDNRTLITIQGNKYQIDPLNKNGTINYVSEGDNVYLTTPKIRANYYKKLNPIEMFDKFVLARNGTDIDGIYSFDGDITFKQNVEVKKDMVVRGNLTVEGNTTIIDTPRLAIEDNIIELNKNETGEGITLRRSGTAINRGNKAFARYIYDEDNKAFVFDTPTGMDNAVDNNLWYLMAFTENHGEFKAGEVRAKFRLSAPHGKFEDSLVVGNNTTLNNLTVEGETALKGLATTNDLTINGILTANNVSIFNGIITANKASTFKDNLTVEKDLAILGATTLTGLLAANGGSNITGDFNVTGPTRLTGILNVSENVSFAKDLAVISNITATNMTASETIRGKNLAITANADIGANVSITGNLTVSKAGVFNRDVTFNNGPVTFNTNVAFNRDISLNNKNFTITSDSDSNGQLLVGGHTFLKKNLTVDGETILKGNTQIQGSLDMTNSDLVARNIKTVNNFTLSPGDGKGIQFWQGDSYKIYMSNSQTPGLGGRLDSNSDYNMYFKIQDGINRGFAFKSGQNVVAQIESTGKIRTLDDIIIKGYTALTRQNEGHKENNSGINADKVDGLHGSDLVRKTGDTMTGNLVFAGATITPIRINCFTNGGWARGINFYKKDTTTKHGSFGMYGQDDVAEHFFFGFGETPWELSNSFSISREDIKYKNNIIWHQGNDGHQSGLDADLLDGHHADYFATATHNHDEKYARLSELDLKNKYAIRYNEEFDSMDFICLE